MTVVVREHSAGGLIVRGDQILLIATREGRWQLPRGHIEPGESSEQAALREIYEETGVYGRGSSFLGTLEFQFSSGARQIAKRVDYYCFQFAGGSEVNFNPQEVAAAAWFPWSEGMARLTFDNERELVEKACKRFRQSR